MAYPPQNVPAQAPYNFVPLPKRVYEPGREEEAVPRHDAFEPGRLCGEIDVEVTTETWLYTRAAVTPEYAAVHPDQNKDVWRDGSPYRHFWHHGDPARPAISGSMFRGMVRNLVTVLADGHLDTAPKGKILYRAVADTTSFGWFYRRRFVGPNTPSRGGTADPNPTSLPQRLEYPVRACDPGNVWKKNSVHGGWLRRDRRDWFIQPAKCHPKDSRESFVHCDERSFDEDLRRKVQNENDIPFTCPVWVQPGPRRDHVHRKPQGDLTLVHAVAERVSTTRFPGAEEAALVVTAKVGPSKHMHCAIFLPDEENTDTLPVDADLWRLYTEDRAQPRGRGRKGRDLEHDVLHPTGDHRHHGVPCFYMLDEKGALVFLGGTLFFRLPYRKSPSERIAPFAGLDLPSALFGRVRGGVRKGRVRVEDLVLEPREASPFSSELPGGYGSPQTLLGPKPACIQNYLEQPSNNPKDLRHYDSDGSKLRGFKFYWHRRQTASPQTASRETDPVGRVAQNAQKTRTVIRPVQQGFRFLGRIAFDNLTPVELGALLTALELKPSMRHKIGMARSLGYGTVKVKARVRLLEPARRYASFFSAAGDGQPGQAGVLEAGWRTGEETDRVCTEARFAFFKALCQFRGQPIAETDAVKGHDRAKDLFWISDRMKELAALLEWDAPPPSAATAPVGIQGHTKSEQWKRRWILPRAADVLRPPPSRDSSQRR